MASGRAQGRPSEGKATGSSMGRASWQGEGLTGELLGASLGTQLPERMFLLERAEGFVTPLTMLSPEFTVCHMAKLIRSSQTGPLA